MELMKARWIILLGEVIHKLLSSFIVFGSDPSYQTTGMWGKKGYVCGSLFGDIQPKRAGKVKVCQIFL